MRYARLLKGMAALPLAMPSAGCVSTAIANDVPRCERLVPASLLKPVDGTPLPEDRKLADGHEDARPWQEAFLGQSVQLEKANERAPAVDHIYRECLAMHREALGRSKRGFFGRLLGG